MDFRVGKIVNVVPNPNSENLYNEEIDIGNGEIRKIASGLQKHIPIDQVKDAMVVCILNLKPRKLADYMSAGMVLCAQPADGSKIEFLQPPAGSQPGDLVTFEGYERKPVEQLPASKPNKPNAWDNIAPGLITDGNLNGCFKDPESGKLLPFTTPKGVCKSSTVKDGIIK
jgi:methionine--tRNA ligase beta chain